MTADTKIALRELPMAPPKGTPKPAGSGRKRGSRNKAGSEVRALCRELLNDPAYLAALKQRLLEGKAGSMEGLVWQYAFGKVPLTSTEDGDTVPAAITIHF